MIVLTVIFALITLWAFRARGAAAGIRGLAVTLLPAAAWLTGSLDLFTGIGNAMVDWARATVRTNQVWGGIGAFAAAVLLWLIGTRMRTSAVARARSAKREKDSHMATGAVANYGGQPTRPAQSSTPVAPAADDLGDVEDILRRRGIS